MSQQPMTEQFPLDLPDYVPPEDIIAAEKNRRDLSPRARRALRRSI